MPCVARRFSIQSIWRGEKSQRRHCPICAADGSGLAGVLAGAVCARARDVANLAQDGFTFHDGGLQVGNAH
jgi:hypothetical protein